MGALNALVLSSLETVLQGPAAAALRRLSLLPVLLLRTLSYGLVLLGTGRVVGMVIAEAGGEIYRYVGDEIIVTWPLAPGARDGAYVACLFAIEDALARKRGDYLRACATEPRLRGALNAGTLVVGEMGDLKREIVMLGDTMNTTARGEEVCKTRGRDFIASEAALRAVGALPPGVRAEPLGKIALRGKEGEVRLFPLTRA
ncbi:MAG TPA: adenylate/guanylate cyclase domain-containing protein [Stellaceae bacterium]|nr:adenylate/guanylate cyclase domain-containing protein [Stellaceae bacterium]